MILTTEMNVSNYIMGRSALPTVRQERISAGVVMFTNAGRKARDNHVSRAADARLIKICNDNQPMNSVFRDEYGNTRFRAGRYAIIRIRR